MNTKLCDDGNKRKQQPACICKRKKPEKRRIKYHQKVSGTAETVATGKEEQPVLAGKEEFRVVEVVEIVEAMEAGEESIGAF